MPRIHTPISPMPYIPPDTGDLFIAYRTEDGTPWVLPVVRTVEAQMSSDETLTHEYLAIDGLRSFTDAAARLLLGEDSVAITENRVGI